MTHLGITSQRPWWSQTIFGLVLAAGIVAPAFTATFASITPSCQTDADCDDGNPCNGSEACIESQCSPGTPADPGTPCDDGNPCTINDQCGEGGNCDVSNIAPGGTPCDDGNPCTLNDTCAGVELGPYCIGGSVSPQCGCCQQSEFLSSIYGESGGSNIFVGCQAPVEESYCTSELVGTFYQGASCNSDTGQCAQSVCGNGTVEPGEECEPFEGQDPICGCDPLTCTYPAVGTACDDGDACTTNDACDGTGTCVGGDPPNCNDNNACTTDTCDSQLGCQNTPNPGQSCDDGDACTVDDVCDSEAVCQGTPKSCAQPVPPCEAGETCNPATGNCEPLPDPPSTTPCDLDQNVCTTDRCDGNGACVFVENAPEGTSCDDGQFCTGTDTCNGSGVCNHTGDPCVGGSECNQTCNEATDNCFDSVGTACSDDGLVCTADACDGLGTCAHSNLPVQQCPKGYVLLEAPSSAAVTAELGYTAQAHDGSACAERVRLKQASLLDGNAVGPTQVHIGKDAAANGSCVTAGSPVVFGPNGQCVGGTDTTGSHSLLADCPGASDKAEQRRLALLALSAHATHGSVTINSNATLNVTPFSGAPGSIVVIDYASLTIGVNRTLTIQGNANTEAVILRIAGNFRARKGSTVVTQGIAPGPNGSPAERVLVLVGGSADVRMNATVNATIFSQGQATVRRYAVLNGALVSPTSPLRVRPAAIVNHAPWVLW